MPVSVVEVSDDLAPPVPAATCPEPDACGRPLRGGTAIGINDQSGGAATCTGGFVSRNGANYHLLTAGHCAQLTGVVNAAPGDPVYGGPDYARLVGWLTGPMYIPSTGDGFDFVRIRVNRAQRFWHPQNMIFQAEDHEYRIVNKVQRLTDALLGDIVCHYGIGTFTVSNTNRCHPLVGLRVDYPQQPGPRNMGVFKTHTCPGDSGGPIWNPANGWAYGITSADDVGDNCAQSTPLAVQYFTWVSDIEFLTGTDIVTHQQRFPS